MYQTGSPSREFVPVSSSQFQKGWWPVLYALTKVLGQIWGPFYNPPREAIPPALNMKKIGDTDSTHLWLSATPTVNGCNINAHKLCAGIQ